MSEQVTFAGLKALGHDTYEKRTCVDVDPAGNTYEVETVCKKDCKGCYAERLENVLKCTRDDMRSSGLIGWAEWLTALLGDGTEKGA